MASLDSVLSVLIIIAIFLTFLPQQVKIFQKKSSLGLSPYFILLGITSVLAQLFNIVLLQIPVLEKCGEVDLSTCIVDMLGIIQIAVLTLSLTINSILFLTYYPRPLSNSSEGRQVRLCVHMFYGFVTLSFLLIVIAVSASGIHSDTTRSIGQLFGWICTLLSCLQYIPQIVKTFATKHIGALSATTLAIQFPGSYFFAYTLAGREGTDISTWFSFFLSGSYQLILLIMCLYISFTQDETTNVWDDDLEENPLFNDANDARTPLLANNQ